MAKNADQFKLMQRQRDFPRKVLLSSTQPLDNFSGVHCDRFIKHFVSSHGAEKGTDCRPYFQTIQTIKRRKSSNYSVAMVERQEMNATSIAKDPVTFATSGTSDAKLKIEQENAKRSAQATNI